MLAKSYVCLERPSVFQAPVRIRAGFGPACLSCALLSALYYSMLHEGLLPTVQKTGEAYSHEKL